MRFRFSYMLPVVAFLMQTDLFAQNNWWHGIERKIHYQPDGEDFLLVNGNRRFNRALYGGNTAFRVEAGDLPEFALYLPGMGGNLKFGLIKNGQSKWLTDADKIETRYRPGSMIYHIADALLDGGSIDIMVLSLFETEGMIVKVAAKNVIGDVQLVAAYGGATGQKFSRDGDIGADPESSFYLKPQYCSDNSYSIHQNEFTVFFGSKTVLTEEERYEIQNVQPQKSDSATNKGNLKTIQGIFPVFAQLKLSDANKQATPLRFYQSDSSSSVALCVHIKLTNEISYFLIQNGKSSSAKSYNDLPSLFEQTENSREQLAGRIKLLTPDPYINTVGGALSVAADAIWEDPSYMHGAVAWRMRLNGWRGAYTADVLGWHDRAEKHFSSYALSQVQSPSSGPVIMDTTLHLARGLEKMGTSFFSSGYISRNPGGDLRPHHYDMNLVFADELLNHFYWTGDTNYVRKMWPLLTTHLDWEKRNFDRDGDGLYDAYAAIWASDALQYSGGGVTHSSAYNYRSNKIATQLAKLVGENGAPYQEEADKILKAMNNKLWLSDSGWFAEYKDLLGNQLVHPSAGLWTIYHTIDSHVPDAFQSYQMLRYVDTKIPHIPIRVSGLNDSTLYTLSTTNWQPYTWSLNNVALAELLHTSLAYWQGGRSEEAYKLWKSSLVESMYLGASPGNFQQLSFYDAIRGELYRDFADVIGMASRSLIEGLFGIEPDLLHDSLSVHPGFPQSWDHASIATPDIEYSFQRKGAVDTYRLTTHFNKPVALSFEVNALLDDVDYVLCNGRKIKWAYKEAIEMPVLTMKISAADHFQIEIKWKGSKIDKPVLMEGIIAKGKSFTVSSRQLEFTRVFDPQHSIQSFVLASHQVKAISNANCGNKTFFIRAKQGKAVLWTAVNFCATTKKELAVTSVSGDEKTSVIQIANNTNAALSCKLFFNHGYSTTVSVKPKGMYSEFALIGPGMIAGTNCINVQVEDNSYAETVVNWDIKNPASMQYEKIDLTSNFNDEVNNIFKNQYLSPRPKTTTLQLPTQGIGNWAYPLTTVNISDSGLRKRAGDKNEIVIEQGIPFAISSEAGSKDIIFTSQWDNYPKQIAIPLHGKSSHAYFLMAGSTNPMQSRLVNGEIIIQYKDGSGDTLQLKNPENWWPIEQDYYEDGYAFTTDAAKPVRVYFKTGEDTRTFHHFMTIRGFSNRGIDGGAATVLDMPLDPLKELKALVLKTIANDVVIGLMSVTLVRP